MSSMNGNYPLHNGTKISTKNRRSVPLRSTIFQMELCSFVSFFDKLELAPERGTWNAFLSTTEFRDGVLIFCMS